MFYTADRKNSLFDVPFVSLQIIRRFFPPLRDCYDLRLLSPTISRTRSRTIASKINAPRKEFAK